MSVVLKEEPGDKFDPDYMEDICSGTFEKGALFLPIENNEVDFSNEMVSKSATIAIYIARRFALISFVYL